MYKNSPTKNVSKSYGGSKSSSFTMKNSMLRKGSMHKTPMQMNYGPMKKMEDLSGDGKITQKDVLMGRGVIPMKKYGSPMEHEPWAAKHRQKPAHSATAEAHGKQPKNTGNKPFTDGKDGAASRSENQ